MSYAAFESARWAMGLAYNSGSPPRSGATRQSLTDALVARTRRASSSNILTAMLGCSLSAARKFQDDNDRVRTGVSATTVAIRGPRSNREISPKKSPGPSRCRVWSPTITLVSPSKRTWRPAPVFPSLTIAPPAGKSTTLRNWPSEARSRVEQPENSGTVLSCSISCLSTRPRPAICASSVDFAVKVVIAQSHLERSARWLRGVSHYNEPWDGPRITWYCGSGLGGGVGVGDEGAQLVGEVVGVAARSTSTASSRWRIARPSRSTSAPGARVVVAAARQADNSNAEPVAQYGRALVDAHLGRVGAAGAAAERGSALAAAGQAAANGGAGRRSAKARAMPLDRAIAYALQHL